MNEIKFRGKRNVRNSLVYVNIMNFYFNCALQHSTDVKNHKISLLFFLLYFFSLSQSNFHFLSLFEIVSNVKYHCEDGEDEKILNFSSMILNERNFFRIFIQFKFKVKFDWILLYSLFILVYETSHNVLKWNLSAVNFSELCQPKTRWMKNNLNLCAYI